MENPNCKNWYDEFNTLPNGQEALVRYSPLPESPEIYKGDTIITKDEFIMAYQRWIKEEANG